jgi:copper homeostasis protein (lipoprotein)
MIACLLLVVLSLATAASAAETPLGSLPATFVGTLPCADCFGIRVQINLLPDGAFTQRKTYLRDGRDESVYEIGAWILNDRTLVLNGGGETRAYWSVVDPRTLRAREGAGREIESRLPFDLTRAPEVLPLEPRVRLRGLFREMPGGARFSDCLSGLQWPVSTSGGYGDLQAAYRVRTKKKASPDLMVTLDARIDATPALGARGEPMLVVERFVRASPGAICMETPGRIALADTRWRPIVVRGQPVRLDDAQHTPWIELDSQRQRFMGSAGCNRISGSWSGTTGDRLRFNGVTATRMACPRMDVEEAFLDALEHTRHYRFSGRNLELIGQDGALLARLEESNLD